MDINQSLISVKLQVLLLDIIGSRDLDSLKILKLNNCGLNRESVEPIVDAIIGNPKLNGVELNLANVSLFIWSLESS